MSYTRCILLIFLGMVSRISPKFMFMPVFLHTSWRFTEQILQCNQKKLGVVQSHVANILSQTECEPQL